jgi:hypothetical protein
VRTLATWRYLALMSCALLSLGGCQSPPLKDDSQIPYSISSEKTKAEAAAKAVNALSVGADKKTQAQILYTDAEASFNGLIDQIALNVKNNQPLNMEFVKNTSRQAVSKSESFISYVQTLQTSQTLSPDVLTTVVNTIVPAVIKSAQQVYTDWQTQDQKQRDSYSQDLAAFKWRDYTTVVGH